MPSSANETLLDFGAGPIAQRARAVNLSSPSSTRPSIRLVATDLDGTLLRSDQVISARTFEVFAQAQAAGVTIVAATGRGPTALPQFDRPGIIEMAVCSNGAIVVDLASGESSAGFGWDDEFASHGQILLDSYGATGSVDFDHAASVSKAFVAHGPPERNTGV